ncbi:conjugal transfer protein, partial [Bacillus thuringiensis]|nr:conjugal transfer protein [Bacillus thuringiensis]
KKLAKEDVTWKRGDNRRENREGRLKPYLLEGAYPQAGLDMHRLQWDANYVQASIVRVKENGKQIADMVLKVAYKLTRKDEGK